MNKKIKYCKFWPLFLQNLIWIPTRIILKLFFDFKVRGLENVKKVPKKYGIIFASNHASGLDPIFIPSALPFLSRFLPTYNMTRGEGKLSYKNKFMNFLLVTLRPVFKLWGAYPVSFLVHKTFPGYMNVLKVHMKMLQERKSVIIFPVGAIKERKIQERPGTGISFIVHNVPCKVIPTQIWIYGLDKNEGLAFKKIFFRKYKIKIFFGEMLKSEDIFSGDEITEKNITDEYLYIANQIVDAIARLGDFH
ncbi:MAG: lysophospholipid acyltransferase family protein [Patescibacteria group bacterium]